jgi:hypothetical protein
VGFVSTLKKSLLFTLAFVIATFLLVQLSMTTTPIGVFIPTFVLNLLELVLVIMNILFLFGVFGLVFMILYTTATGRTQWKEDTIEFLIGLSLLSGIIRIFVDAMLDLNW